MDAASLTAECERELADLRRRAYGPNADIADDPRAVDRLRELEALARPGAAVASRPRVHGAPPSGPTASESTPTANTAPSAAVFSSTGPAEIPSASGGAEAASESTSADERTPAGAAPTTSSASWWRRIPTWVLVGAGVVAGVALGVAGMSVSTPQPDLTLRVAPGGGDRGPDWGSELSSWGLDPESAVPFEEYDGVGVWLLRSDEGSSCIVLEDEGRPVTAGCASGGLDPVLDVTTYVEADALFDAERPVGSVTRFVGRGSVVEVWERFGRTSADAAHRGGDLRHTPETGPSPPSLRMG